MDSNLLNQKQLDDLNSSLNVILASIKADIKEFPPLDILEEIKQCLECLANSKLLDKQRANYISLSWPADLRIVLTRLFRTFKIPEEYIQKCYELCAVAVQSLGSEWLKSDSQFLRMLASLSSGRLRIVLDNPSEVNASQMVSCLQLQEFFFSCVEQEWMSDEEASFVAKCCQEAVSFACQYAVESAREVNIAAHIDLFMALYRFICAFLSIGGAEIIDKALLNNTLPVLISICKICLDHHHDSTLAWYLLDNLLEFDDPLPDESLSLLTKFVAIALTERKSEKEKVLEQFADLLEQFAGRKGQWRTEASMANLKQLAKVNPKNDRLNSAVQQILANTIP